MGYKPKKFKPIVRQLEDKYGGKWKYITGAFWWECEELGLFAYYVANGGYDINGNYIQPFIRTMYVCGLKNRTESFTPDQTYGKLFNNN